MILGLLHHVKIYEKVKEKEIGRDMKCFVHVGSDFGIGFFDVFMNLGISYV